MFHRYRELAQTVCFYGKSTKELFFLMCRGPYSERFCLSEKLYSERQPKRFVEVRAEIQCTY
jgi:hypothetical protein